MRTPLALCTAFLCLAGMSAEVQSTTWYIKPDGSGDKPDIKTAATMASDLDTILLAPGYFTGPGNRDIVLNSAVFVLSDSGAAVTIIDCEGLGAGFSTANDFLYEISGLTIIAAAAPGAIVAGTAGAVVVTGNNVQDGAGGITISNSNNATIEDNTVSGGTGIEVSAGGTVSIRNNNVIGTHGEGIRVTGPPTTATIENNIVFKVASGDGIIYGGDFFATATIVDNVVTDSPGVGILCFCSTGAVTIGGNVVSGSAEEGIRFDTCPAIDISENTIAYNTGSGIYEDGLVAGMIANNVVAFNQGFGVECFVSELTCNDLFGNVLGDVICGVDGGGNISLDPEFCAGPFGDFTLAASSPCLVQACGAMGALGQGCAPTGVPFNGAPPSFVLHQNIPNPFTTETVISFDVPSPGAFVSLVVYDVQGRVVRALADEWLPGGPRTVVWDGRDHAGGSVASGVYFCRLTAPGFTATRKMALLE